MDKENKGGADRDQVHPFASPRAAQIGIQRPSDLALAGDRYYPPALRSYPRVSTRMPSLEEMEAPIRRSHPSYSGSQVRSQHLAARPTDRARSLVHGRDNFAVSQLARSRPQLGRSQPSHMAHNQRVPPSWAYDSPATMHRRAGYGTQMPGTAGRFSGHNYDQTLPLAQLRRGHTASQGVHANTANSNFNGFQDEASTRCTSPPCFPPDSSAFADGYRLGAEHANFRHRNPFPSYPTDAGLFNTGLSDRSYDGLAQVSHITQPQGNSVPEQHIPSTRPTISSRMARPMPPAFYESIAHPKSD